MGVEPDALPQVRRTAVELESGRTLSALVWGEAEPEVVFVHGGGQNAHTWDSVLVVLGLPALALDLPGHGNSGRPRSGGMASPRAIAEDIAPAIEALAPRAHAVVGMSLGGLAGIALCETDPARVGALALIDVTPAADRERTRGVVDFITGPATFDSFNEILERTIAFHPERSVSSLRRGVIHDWVRGSDGHWTWRYRRFDDEPPLGADHADFTSLWSVLGTVAGPVLLVRGMLPGSAVRDEDERELARRVPHATIVRVPEAGHSVQGDQPLELARVLGGFLRSGG